MPVPAVMKGGMPTVSSGSAITIAGSIFGWKITFLVWLSSCVMTPARPTSEPVPAVVGTATIGAIFEVGIYDYDGSFVVMPMADAQTLLLIGDTVGMIEVTVTDPDEVETILAPVQESLAGRAIVSDWKTINASLFEALQVERVAMAFALSFMVLVAAFNILSSLVMLVRAKTRDIAIMRTMGATRKSLLKIFVTTGFTVGAIGTIAGLILGAVVLFFRQPIVEFIGAVTGQDLWDPQVRFLSTLPARANPVEIALIVLLALALSFLATLYPALKASSTDPVQVLRYE